MYTDIDSISQMEVHSIATQEGTWRKSGSTTTRKNSYYYHDGGRIAPLPRRPGRACWH